MLVTTAMRSHEKRLKKDLDSWPDLADDWVVADDPQLHENKNFIYILHSEICRNIYRSFFFGPKLRRGKTT